MWSYFGDLLRREELPNSSSCNLPCRKLRDVEKGVKKLLCALGHQKGSVQVIWCFPHSLYGLILGYMVLSCWVIKAPAGCMALAPWLMGFFKDIWCLPAQFYWGAGVSRAQCHPDIERKTTVTPAPSLPAAPKADFWVLPLQGRWVAGAEVGEMEWFGFVES